MQKYSEVMAGVLWLALAGGASAQESSRAPTSVQTLLPRGLAVPDTVSAEHRGWRPLAAAVLADKRAGSDTVSNNMDVAGSVSSNVASNVVTGANAISAGSFANAAGLPVAIQNSGANVLIQNATIINVQMR